MNRLPPFDQMKVMAEQEPKTLYKLLNREVEKIISTRKGAARARLQGLQFEINCQKKLAKNPIDSLLRIYRMMNRSMERLAEVLQSQGAATSVNDNQIHAERETPKSKVIPLFKNDHS